MITADAVVASRMTDTEYRASSFCFYGVYGLRILMASNCGEVYSQGRTVSGHLQVFVDTVE